jgi:hypothetical protein
VSRPAAPLAECGAFGAGRTPTISQEKIAEIVD